MKWILLGGTLLALQWTDARAHDRDPSACVAIQSDLRRLQCFDESFSVKAEPRDPAVAVCERWTVERLRSPSSYLLIKSSMYGNYVNLEYDAQNGYGAVIRGYQTCYFAAYNNFVYMLDADGVSMAYSPFQAKDTKIDYAAAELEYKKIHPALTAKSDEELANECGTALKLEAGGFTHKILVDPTGMKTVYLTPKAGSDAAGKCDFRASEMLDFRALQ